MSRLMSRLAGTIGRAALVLGAWLALPVAGFA